ncbi:MAG: class I SAM-dependent methyltransferase [Anaerolineae bacterium]
MDKRAHWNERYRTGNGPRTVNARLAQYLPLLTRGRALDLACGVGQNARLLVGWDLVLVDLAEEALAQGRGLRVQATASALPFPPGVFDTVVDTYFFDSRVDFYFLLAPGGTLFFETYTTADVRYRPEFCPAHRLDLAQVPQLLRGMEILVLQETDNGHRVYATIVARKPAHE